MPGRLSTVAVNWLGSHWKSAGDLASPLTDIRYLRLRARESVRQRGERLRTGKTYRSQW